MPIPWEIQTSIKKTSENSEDFGSQTKEGQTETLQIPGAEKIVPAV